MKLKQAINNERWCIIHLNYNERFLFTNVTDCDSKWERILTEKKWINRGLSSPKKHVWLSFVDTQTINIKQGWYDANLRTFEWQIGERKKAKLLSSVDWIASELVMIDCSDTLNEMISQDATTNPIALKVLEEWHTRHKTLCINWIKKQ